MLLNLDFKFRDITGKERNIVVPIDNEGGVLTYDSFAKFLGSQIYTSPKLDGINAIEAARIATALYNTGRAELNSTETDALKKYIENSTLNIGAKEQILQAIRAAENSKEASD